MEPSGSGFRHVLTAFSRWWKRDASGTVDQEAVIEKRREEGALSARYLLMITMSAGIAILGLLQSSQAVVIGAMLLSPLMGPIMGVGFSIAIGDFNWLRESAISLAVGTIFAVLFCALVVFFSPLQTVTSEIAARTKPNLFDLLIALFSAVAGAYAMIRGREGTIVGVAIATALMPPLAVVGFGLATFNWTVFSGALLLFFTNLMTIALTATAMARIYGFRTNLSAKQTQFQSALIVIAFVALGIPLGLTLRKIAWEATAQHQISSQMLDAFGSRARLAQLEMNLDTVPIQVSATVLTPKLVPDAEKETAKAMTKRLGRPVDVQLTQYRVGTSAQAAEEAQLRNAIANEQADAQRADELAKRLALVAGVSPSQVTVDRERRRATVRAQPLPGATLAAYQELEGRIRAMRPNWTIDLIPPVRPLSGIPFVNKQPAPSVQQEIAVIAWAQKRLDMPVEISGRASAVKLVAKLMSDAGITFTAKPGRRGFGTVKVQWVPAAMPSPAAKE